MLLIIEVYISFPFTISWLAYHRLKINQLSLPHQLLFSFHARAVQTVCLSSNFHRAQGYLTTKETQLKVSGCNRRTGRGQQLLTMANNIRLVMIIELITIRARRASLYPAAQLLVACGTCCASAGQARQFGRPRAFCLELERARLSLREQQQRRKTKAREMIAEIK